MNVFSPLRRLAARARADERGAILAEYGLLAVGIAVVVAPLVWALGRLVVGLYDLPAPF